MQPRVVVISTGGTIAMRYDDLLGGETPAVGGKELLAAVPAISKRISVEVEEFDNIPSSCMTPEIMMRLAKVTESALGRKDVTGIVITHGTDTLEETAFFLDCYLHPQKPICLTGAMRSGSDLSGDGPYNLESAIRVAGSPQAAGRGVLVVMNGEIHAARHVTKMHSSNTASFMSSCHGPVGYADADAIHFGCSTPSPLKLQPSKLANDVPILKIYSGMDNRLPVALLAMQPDGLVIEGYGRGNIPASVVPTLIPFFENDIPVVIASRVPMGRTLGVYAHEGGAAHLQKLGAILSGSLSSHKARLLLMLTLGLGQDLKTIRDSFTTFSA